MPKKGENIRKRKDGRWEGRYKKGRSFDGSVIYGSVYGDSYNDVKEKLKKFSWTKDINSELVYYGILFKEVLQQWQNINKLSRKGATVNKYQNIIDLHIIPVLGDIRVEDINAPMVNEILLEKLKNGRLDGKGGLSHSYVRSIMIIIKSALNYAAAEKLCSPLKSKIYTPSTDYPEYQVLSHEDQERLELSLCFERDMTNLGIFITLYTGLRIGEICALSWDDIDLQNRVLHVRHTIARIRKDDGRKSNTELILDSPKTKASIRDIPITENLYKVLVNASKHSISRFVVSNSNSFVSPRTYEYRYQKIMELSGVERVNYHCLRHTFATRCIEAGVDIKTLSEILGHANVAVTLNTYVHSSMEMKRNQLEKLHHLQTI